MTPDPTAPATTTVCSTCHKPDSVDSLTGRCTACRPVQLSDLEPSIQDYARRARWQKYKEFLVGFSLGPISIGIILFYSSRGKGVAPLLFWLVVIATPIVMGASVYSLFRKDNCCSVTIGWGRAVGLSHLSIPNCSMKLGEVPIRI